MIFFLFHGISFFINSVSRPSLLTFTITWYQIQQGKLNIVFVNKEDNLLHCVRKNTFGQRIFKLLWDLKAAQADLDQISGART